MNSKLNEMIFVRINKVGFIPQLKIQGPIPNPIKITRKQAHSLIVAGIQVFQIDPDTKQATELTLKNVFAEEEKTSTEQSQNKTEKKTATINPVAKNDGPFQFQGVKTTNEKIPMNLKFLNGDDKFEVEPEDKEATTSMLSKVEKGEVISTITN